MSSGYDIDDLPPVYSTTPIADIGYPRFPVPAMHISGCNLRCPYCINAEMIRSRNMGDIDPRGFVDSCVSSLEKMIFLSGGEPLFNKKTPNLLYFIKKKGIQTAIATNGTNPNILKKVMDDGIVDYVVMDIKSSLSHDEYAKVSGMTSFDRHLDSVIQSIDILRSSGIGCEFRTTMCSKYVSIDDAMEIAKFLGKDQVYVLQYYTTHQTLRPDMATMDYVIPYEELVEAAWEMEKYVRTVIVSEV